MLECELDDGIVASDEKIVDLKACVATLNDLPAIRDKINEIAAEIDVEMGKAEEKRANIMAQVTRKLYFRSIDATLLPHFPLRSGRKSI